MLWRLSLLMCTLWWPRPRQRLPHLRLLPCLGLLLMRRRRRQPHLLLLCLGLLLLLLALCISLHTSRPPLPAGCRQDWRLPAGASQRCLPVCRWSTRRAQQMVSTACAAWRDGQRGTQLCIEAAAHAHRHAVLRPSLLFPA